MFPVVREQVSRLIDISKIRHIGFSHFESDECGSLNQLLELTPEGVHVYNGGYTEYVTSTGHEAPGLHS